MRYIIINPKLSKKMYSRAHVCFSASAFKNKSTLYYAWLVLNIVLIMSDDFIDIQLNREQE